MSVIMFGSTFTHSVSQNHFFPCPVHKHTFQMSLINEMYEVALCPACAGKKWSNVLPGDNSRSPLVHMNGFSEEGKNSKVFTLVWQIRRKKPFLTHFTFMRALQLFPLRVNEIKYKIPLFCLMIGDFALFLFEGQKQASFVSLLRPSN